MHVVCMMVFGTAPYARSYNFLIWVADLSSVLHYFAPIFLEMGKHEWKLVLFNQWLSASDHINIDFLIPVYRFVEWLCWICAHLFTDTSPTKGISKMALIENIPTEPRRYFYQSIIKFSYGIFTVTDYGSCNFFAVYMIHKQVPHQSMVATVTFMIDIHMLILQWTRW